MGETPRTEGRRRLWPTFRPLSSVRGRIIAGFGLLVLILAAVVAGSAWQVRAHRSTLATMEEHTVTASLLEEITVDTMFAGANMEHYILTGDETVFDEIQGSAARSLQNLVEVRSRVEAGGHDELELAIDDITITAFGAGATLDEIIELRRTSGVDAATAALDESLPSLKGFWADLQEAAAIEHRQAALLRSEADRSGEVALWLLIISGGAGAVVAAAASVVIARSIIKPLSSLEQTAVAVARGDLEARAEAVGPRELARLSASLNGMTESLLDASKRRELEAERERAHARLRESEERYRSLVETSPDAITMTDLNNNIIMVNQQAVALHGCSSAEEMIGRTALEFIVPEERPRAIQAGRKALEAGTIRNVEYTLLRKDGTTFPAELSASCIVDDDGKPEGFIGVVRDVTERKRAEETIRHLAYHDALTNLPNRALLADRLTLALAQARREESSLALMFLDLDRLKVVNDTAGHSVGDDLLRSVAQRLTGLVRDGDTVARIGGDEFALILPGVERPEDVAKIAENILNAIQQPFRVDGQELHTSVSVGVALYPGDGEEAETLLGNADLAMYRAKELGRGSYQLYTPTMNADIRDKLALETDLRRALERGEFLVYYQPQTEIETGRILGMEALVRWQHPQRGLVLPAEFIPAAEETGLIVPLGAWVLRTACAQTKAWHEVGFPPMTIAVNLSARQFRERNLREIVAAALADAGLEARYLQLEITEGIAMQDTDFSIATLRALREMGVEISIDDFGTGHSSLSYLKRLPINAVKIDQSFVRDIAFDPDDAAIASAIIAMARHLGLSVIAEGVETDEQLAILREQQCSQFQGYLYSRPLPPDEVEEMLRRNKPLPTPASRPKVP